MLDTVYAGVKTDGASGRPHALHANLSSNYMWQHNKTCDHIQWAYSNLTHRIRLAWVALEGVPVPLHQLAGALVVQHIYLSRGRIRSGHSAGLSIDVWKVVS